MIFYQPVFKYCHELISYYHMSQRKDLNSIKKLIFYNNYYSTSYPFGRLAPIPLGNKSKYGNNSNLLKYQNQEKESFIANSIKLCYYSSKKKSPSPNVRIEGQFKTYKPRTPGLRWLKRPVNDHLWKGKPIRKLTKAK